MTPEGYAAGAAGAPPGVGQYRPRPAWKRAWPIYPVLLFLIVLFVYPVAQLLSLSVLAPEGGLTATYSNCLPETGMLRFGAPRQAS